MLQCHERFFFPVKHKFWFIQRKLYSYQIFSKVKYELHKKDFKSYFDSLLKDPIIIAEDAVTHEATSCFAESYLKPLNPQYPTLLVDQDTVIVGSIIGSFQPE